MALNVKPLYPLDHPEVTYPEMEVDKVETTYTKNNYTPMDENLKPIDQKITDIKKLLDVIG